MAHLTDIGFTLSELNSAVADGRVRTQTHPEFPTLTIANYTEEVQYRNQWDKITLNCRGLIYDSDTGEVVARPWKKFFNFGQHDNEIESNAPVEVTDKLDGSLGILYRQPDGDLAIATRGSFASDQARHANTLLYSEYSELLERWRESYHSGEYWLNRNTYLFEIIYPENRIVCDYEGMDDLVMLGAVDREYGTYYGPIAAAGQLGWTGAVADSWHYNSFVDAVSFPDREGKEGVVIRSGNKMVKLKQQDYVELHRIVTNLSPKTIWEMLGAGRTVSDICAEIPDEFHKYVRDIGDDLFLDYADIKLAANINFDGAKAEAYARADESGNISRKKWAEAIKKREYPALLFMMLDDKTIDDAVWKMIKPRGDAKFLADREDNA